MANINITITKANMVATVETLLWKYGKSIEGDANYKQVFNTQSEHGTYDVDNKVLSDSFIKRSREAIEMLRDFISGSINYDATTGDPSVTLNMPTRWASKDTLLQAAVDRYVEDGMMADWLNVTAPTEATIFTTRLTQDETDIRVELYAKKQP